MESFDGVSGLMFTETTSARIRTMVATWMYQARGKPANPSEYRNRGRGCSRLQETVLRWIIWNIDSVEVEALQFLGWHYASQLYTELKQTECLTFNAWNLFRQAFPNEIDRRHHFNVYEREANVDELPLYGQDTPPAQLPSIVKRLTTLDSTNLVSICIKGFDLTLEDLMSLLPIKALSSLILTPRRVFHHASVRLDEKHFRDWGRAVRESGAFLRLGLLVLNKFDMEREAILQGVSSFPSLALVGTNRWRWESKSLEETYGSWHIISDEMLAQDPSELWNDNSITTEEKMALLNTLATEMLQTHSKDVANLLVGVTYASNSCNIVSQDHLEWFYRDPVESRSSNKRDDSNLSPRKAAIEKRRRVRENKQVDVGSLLGSFT